MRVPCPRYYEELARVMDSPEVLERLSQLGLEEMSDYLSDYANMTINSPDDIQSLYNTLLGEVRVLSVIDLKPIKYFLITFCLIQV